MLGHSHFKIATSGVKMRRVDLSRFQARTSGLNQRRSAACPQHLSGEDRCRLAGRDLRASLGDEVLERRKWSATQRLDDPEVVALKHSDGVPCLQSDVLERVLRRAVLA